MGRLGIGKFQQFRCVIVGNDPAKSTANIELHRTWSRHVIVNRDGERTTVAKRVRLAQIAKAEVETISRGVIRHVLPRNNRVAGEHRRLTGLVGYLPQVLTVAVLQLTKTTLGHRVAEELGIVPVRTIERVQKIVHVIESHRLR